MHSVCVSVSQCVLVHAFCDVHNFLTQRLIGFIFGVLMPYNVGNKMQMGMLGQRSELR